MTRKKNVDIFRAIALLLVLVYHGWVLTGSYPFSNGLVRLIISLGGEIGVTAFFALSGYGIYYSLMRMEQKNGHIRYKDFLLKRAERILPEYYLSIAVVVIFSFASYLSADGLKNIGTHLLFIHNLFPAYHGSINGVLWTMGVMVQFYMIAPIMYKSFRKYGKNTEVVCILITIAAKYFVYAYGLPYLGKTQYTFFVGRQLLTALDNFSIGMFAAHLVAKEKNQLDKDAAGFICGMSVITLVMTCQLGMIYGIHTNNISGYIWHTLLSIAIGGIIFSISYMPERKESVIYRILLWLSEYEYGIYIWHMLILNKILQYIPQIQQTFGTVYSQWIYLLYMPLAICFGSVVSKGIDLIKIKLKK